jgi:hypothetical protein
MNKVFRLIGIAFILAVLLLLQHSYTPATASSGLESRISRLEAENFQLRSQLSRLENEVSRLTGLDSRPQRVNQSAPRVAPMPPQRLPSTLGDDPMFKRLATLVIELKERVVALENQLNNRGR